MSTTIVSTTIGDGAFIEHYVSAFRRAGLGDVTLIAIPDLKTPASCYEAASRLTGEDVTVLCPTMEEQEAYLRRLCVPESFVPVNSDNRRNIGFLMALELGHEVVVSIDDDNYCVDGPAFLREHGVVAEASWTGESLSSGNGWYNICERLTLTPPAKVYPRGYPYNRRHQSDDCAIATVETGTVRLNAGLWLRDPDLDAATWLTTPVQAIDADTTPVLLGDDTWSPVNTQNTGLHIEVLPSYYYLPMGFPTAWGNIDRYGDILSGYFAQACVRQMGHKVRIGPPFVEHRRNAHNYMKDLSNELAGMNMMDELCAWVRRVHLDGATYSDSYASLADQLETAVETFKGPVWTSQSRAYFHFLAYCMREWLKACGRIIG